MTFLLGGVSVGQAANPLVWIFALISFVFDLGEEIAGDAMDMAGDQKRASKSIAILHGKKFALRVSGLLFGGVILLTLVPLLWGLSNPGYIIPIAIMDGLVVFFTVRLLKSLTPSAGRGSMRGLYLSATLGLFAFILGTYIR